MVVIAIRSLRDLHATTRVRHPAQRRGSLAAHLPRATAGKAGKQRRLLDHHIRPHALQQLVLGDEMTRALDHGREQIEGHGAATGPLHRRSAAVARRIAARKHQSGSVRVWQRMPCPVVYRRCPLRAFSEVPERPFLYHNRNRQAARCVRRSSTSFDNVRWVESGLGHINPYNGGVVFADLDRAKLVHEINLAIASSKTWGEFRQAMPHAEYSEIPQTYAEDGAGVPTLGACFVGSADSCARLMRSDRAAGERAGVRFCRRLEFILSPIFAYKHLRRSSTRLRAAIVPPSWDPWKSTVA